MGSPRRSPARFLWAPLNALQALFTVIWTALWISVALAVAALARRPAPALWLARWVWAPGLLAGAGARLRVTGGEQLDPARPALVVANHQSWIDIPALFRALPVPLRYLAKRELGAVPFLGAYIRAMGMVFVDRGAPRAASRSVGTAAALLARGAHVVSFPEGTRSADGRPGHFKSGGFGAALEAGADVLPVAIVGAGRVLTREGLFRVRPGVIEVRIGRPIPTTGLPPGARAALARRAESAVRTLLAAEPAPSPAGASVGLDFDSSFHPNETPTGEPR